MRTTASAMEVCLEEFMRRVLTDAGGESQRFRQTGVSAQFSNLLRKAQKKVQCLNSKRRFFESNDWKECQKRRITFPALGTRPWKSFMENGYE